MQKKNVGGSVFDPQGVPYKPFAGDDGTGEKGMRGVDEVTSGELTDQLQKASMGRKAAGAGGVVTDKPFTDDSFKKT